jgi:Zn-dependent M28 family amino/carboxypeptidase
LLVVGCSSGPAAAPAAREARSSSSPSPAGLSAAGRAALASRDARRVAASLADEVGPRLAGSPGGAAALTWAEHTMHALKLANVHLEPVSVPVWRRGEERARIVSGGSEGRSLDVAALGWSGSTAPEGIVADVLRVETVDALASLPDDAVRGKIVFVDASMKRTADGSGYGRAVPVRYRAQTMAAAKGAYAALIRSVGTDADHPHTGATNRGDAPGIPIGALSNASADLLAHEIASGPTRLSLVMTSQRLPDAPSANVVGEVVGREKPDEIVLLAAHLDSWDLARGAIDDAAGCGAVLDAIRVIAAQAPARTVRVVLFAAEENSGAGGKEYVRAHAGEVDKIVLSLEVDSGTDRVMSLGFVGAPDQAPTLRAIAEPLSQLGVSFHDGKGHAGADVTPLVSHGVPSVDVGQDVSRYFDIHHTAADTSDKLDAEALAQVTAVVAHIASRAADAGVSFGRVPQAQRKDD